VLFLLGIPREEIEAAEPCPVAADD